MWAPWCHLKTLIMKPASCRVAVAGALQCTVHWSALVSSAQCIGQLWSARGRAVGLLAGCLGQTAPDNFGLFTPT